MKTSARKPLRQQTAVAGVGISLVAALALAGCSESAGASGGDTSSVAVGASAEEYAEALADMEATELVFQIGGSSESMTSQPYIDFAERVEEYSGGKITMDLAWNNAIIPNTTEIDRGLLDGRLDIGVVYSAYNAQDYPVNNTIINTTVLRDPSILTGTLASAASYEEATLNTPEAVAEFTDKGLTPLFMMQPESPTVMFCSEPLTTLEDLKGKQVRAATPGLAQQIEALGAVPVSMAYNEIYEALQRGILDCGTGIHGLGVLGMFEVAPYVMHTTSAAFISTPTPYFAGIRFQQMPAEAQQLVIELFKRAMGEIKELQVASIVEESLVLSHEYGGEFVYFDEEVSERLAEVNEEILADVRASELFDGAEFIERLQAGNEEWVDRVTELGYVDAGTVAEVGEWYSRDLGSGFTEVLVEELVPLNLENRAS